MASKEEAPLTGDGDAGVGQSSKLDAEVRRAVELILGSQALLVVAGAGLADMCRHELFVQDPKAAWAFHGPVLQRFREAVPHEGYSHLRRICQTKGASSHFVCTSNVDGLLEKVGFEPKRLFNAHGSVHFWQCMCAKCNKRHSPWPAGDWTPGKLPECKFCKKMARPNVSLFDDNLGKNADSFCGQRVLEQFDFFENWLKQVGRQKLCIIEIGCGVSEHSLRLVPKPGGKWAFMSDEWGLPPVAASLVRINPTTEDCQPEARSLAEGNKAAACG
ncbi:unnamed protein product [Polarella glacialis]|uniref:Deacetylase sirtuin-type domain-containing protein n=1 Tax=Polarella glacialis TaxID=89957 RepID=A0A813K341_POLGL|nr:unnamed protein product [Polarella glacialis]